MTASSPNSWATAFWPFFGFPGAHEDDAARAVHAGLEIAGIVAALQTRARARGAGRDRDRARRGPRSHRERLGAGASSRWRHPQPRRPVARSRRGRHVRRHGESFWRPNSTGPQPPVVQVGWLLGPSILLAEIVKSATFRFVCRVMQNWMRPGRCWARFTAKDVSSAS
jgi:hypothetical protein